jgi:hypothetical protein
MVQVILNGSRYVAVEQNGMITLNRDGAPIGKAKWKDDQLIDNTAVLPDDVVIQLEKKIKERMDANWDED